MSWQGSNNAGNNGPGGNPNSGFRRNSYRQSTEDGEIGEEEGEIVGGSNKPIPSHPPTGGPPPPPHSASGPSPLSSSSPSSSLHRGGSSSSFSSLGAAPLHRSFSASGSEPIPNRGNRGPNNNNPSGFTTSGPPPSIRNPNPSSQQPVPSLQQQQPPISRAQLPPQQLQQPRGGLGSGPPPFGRPLRGRGGGIRSSSLTYQRPSGISGHGMSRPDGPVRSASFTPAAATMNQRPTDPRLQQVGGQRPSNFVPPNDRSTQQQQQGPPLSQQQPPPQQQSSSPFPPRGPNFPGGDRLEDRPGSNVGGSSGAIHDSEFNNERGPIPPPLQQQQQQPSGSGNFRSSTYIPAGGDNRPPLPSSLDRRSSTGDRPPAMHHHQHHAHTSNNPGSTTTMDHPSGYTVRQSHHQPPSLPPASSSSASLDRMGLPEEAPIIPLPQHSSYSSLADSSPFPIPKKRDNDERFGSTGDANRGIRRGGPDGRGSFPPSTSGLEYPSRRSSTDLMRDGSVLSRNTTPNYDYYGGGGGGGGGGSNVAGSDPALPPSAASSSRPPHGRGPPPHDGRRESGFGSNAEGGSVPGRPPLPPQSGPLRAPFHRNDPRFPGKSELHPPSHLSEPMRSSSGDGRGPPADFPTMDESIITGTASNSAFGPDRSSRETSSSSRGIFQGGEPPLPSAADQLEGPQQRSPPFRKNLFRGSPLPPPLTSSQLLGSSAPDATLGTARRPSTESVESGYSSGRGSRFGPPLSISSSPSTRKPVLSYMSSSSPASSPRKMQQQLNRLPPSAPSLNLVVDEKEPHPVHGNTNTASSGTSTEPVATQVLAMSSIPSMATSKPPDAEKSIRKPPLLTSALGQSKARAEEAIILLKDLISDETNLKEEEDEAVGAAPKLPAKDVIMKAMNKLNTKIEEVQSFVLAMEADCEEAQALLKAKELERIEKEEQERVAAEARIQEERDKEEEKKRQKEEEEIRLQEEFQQFMECKRQLLDEELEKEAKEMENRIVRIQESDRLRKQQELDEQINVAASKFEKDLAKARRELNRAEQAATKAEVKVATMEAEYRAKKKEQEEIPPPETEEEPKGPSVNEIVSNVLAENQRRAAEAHLSFPFSVSMDDPFANLIDANENTNLRGLELASDPKHNRTNLEWSILARQVTGPADALYTEPSEAPYFEQNERIHELIGPLVKEYIRDRQRRLSERWKDLAEEYVVRKQIYTKQINRSSVAKKSQRSMSISSRKSIFGDKVSATGAASIVSGSRNSSNPYRRARRGNEVRSEYEQEQIIAEIAAKEAMEKRIAHGGSYIPRQIIPLEKELTAVFIKDFEAQKINDPVAAEEALGVTNVWSDMEKAIFLDRFLQYPKDFRKIATFLRNKTTKDCIAFYYNSKQTVPYKTALKEHIMRRKRRGDYPVWDATIQAALSVGATVSAGNSDDRPLLFSPPEDETTYFTHGFHPMKLETFATLEVSDDALIVEEEITEKRKSRKRSQEPLFVVDAAVQKLLRPNKDSDIASASEGANDLQGSESASGRLTPVKRLPQKWTLSERKLFLEAVNKYGKDWTMLVAAVGTKSLPQIKNYYYDFKKQSGKRRSSMDNLQPEEKRPKLSISEKLLRRENSATESVPTSLPDETSDIQIEIKDDVWAQSIDLAQQQQMLSEEETLPQSSSAVNGLNQSDLWAQVQQQALLQSQQHQQLQHSQLSVEDALRLLHHNQQTQQQQQQQQLMSWLNATQVAQVHANALQQQHRQQHHPTEAATLAAALAGSSQGSGHNSQEWGDIATQMQSFLSLRQGGHHAFSLPSATTNSHLSSLALAGLSGLSHLHLDSTPQPSQQRGNVASESGLLGPSSTGAASAIPHGFMYPSLGSHEAAHSMSGGVLDVLGLFAAAQGRSNTRGDGSSVYQHLPYNMDGSNPDGSDMQDNY